jgi:hypothetical protein
MERRKIVINKIPMGINNIDEIIEKLREVIDAVNPVIEMHKPSKDNTQHTHKQFHVCPKCGCEYFSRLGSSSDYKGHTELLQCCECGERMSVQQLVCRRYEVTPAG